MKISFCTTCMDRVHHLKETLPKNIHDNPALEGLDIEFVVLNYNSGDDLHEWITTDPEMIEHMETGALRYARTTDTGLFHHAHAKNIAHRLATGDVLCNVDADNFTGNNFAGFLRNLFEEDNNIVVNPSKEINQLFSPENRGCFGRIAISRENFYKLHGYDESFQIWGGEDNNFLHRAKLHGSKHLRIDDVKYINFIAHSNLERVKNTVSPDKIEEETRLLDRKKNAGRLSMTFVSSAIGMLSKLAFSRPGNSIGMANLELFGGEKVVLDEIQGARSSGLKGAFDVCVHGLPELVRGRLSPRLAKDQEYDHNRPEIFDC